MPSDHPSQAVAHPTQNGKTVTFVMISQNRADARRQVIADQGGSVLRGPRPDRHDHLEESG
jgi:hypothetical protein